jgi:hypothetical protein
LLNATRNQSLGNKIRGKRNKYDVPTSVVYLHKIINKFKIKIDEKDKKIIKILLYEWETNTNTNELNSLLLVDNENNCEKYEKIVNDYPSFSTYLLFNISTQFRDKHARLIYTLCKFIK